MSAPNSPPSVPPHSAPAAEVQRRPPLLPIVAGASYTAAARLVGHSHNQTISAWVSRFNREGLSAVPRTMAAGRGSAMALRRSSASWPSGRVHPSADRWHRHLVVEPAAEGSAPSPGGPAAGQPVHHRAHPARGRLSWQKSRTWCETGVALRNRKHGMVRVSDPDAAVKKSSSSRPTRTQLKGARRLV